MTQILWPQCKIHNLDLIYSTYWDIWACQNIECPFSNGVNLEEMDAYTLGS